MQSLNPRGVGQTIRWPNHLAPLAPCACISTLNVMHPYPLPLFTVNPYPRRTTEPQLTALCPTPELQEIRTYIHHLPICVQSYLPTNVHTYIHPSHAIHKRGSHPSPESPYRVHACTYVHTCTHTPRRSNEAETEERGWLASDAHHRILYTFRGPRLHVCTHLVTTRMYVSNIHTPHALRKGLQAVG